MINFKYSENRTDIVGENEPNDWCGRAKFDVNVGLKLSRWWMRSEEYKPYGRSSQNGLYRPQRVRVGGEKNRRSTVRKQGSTRVKYINYMNITLDVTGRGDFMLNPIPFQARYWNIDVSASGSPFPIETFHFSFVYFMWRCCWIIVEFSVFAINANKSNKLKTKKYPSFPNVQTHLPIGWNRKNSTRVRLRKTVKLG